MRYFLFNNYKQNTTSLSLLVGTIVPTDNTQFGMQTEYISVLDISDVTICN